MSLLNDRVYVVNEIHVLISSNVLLCLSGMGCCYNVVLFFEFVVGEGEEPAEGE